MKKIVTFTVAAALLLCSTTYAAAVSVNEMMVVLNIAAGACTVRQMQSGQTEAGDGIVMGIKEGTISSTGVTVIISNTTGIESTFGSYYEVEKKEGGEWTEIPYLESEYERGWTSIGYPVGSDSFGIERELAEDWRNLYGPLTPGTYRIMKDYHTGEAGAFTRGKVYAEFEIK